MNATRRQDQVPRSRRLALALALASLLLVADQLTKWIVLQEWANLPRGGDLLRLRLTYNSGISFSQLSDSGSLVLILVSVVAAGVAVGIVVAPARYRPALGVILGGALGNIVDRFRYDGAVLDFIGVWRWPSFNVADVAVVAGTAWLALLLLRGTRA